MYAISLVISSLLLIAILYLSQFQYARKETVRGYLLPKSGVIKVYVDRAGILAELFVSEEGPIHQGEPLAKIRNRRDLADGTELSSALSNEIKIQIQALKKEMTLAHAVFDADEKRIRQQLYTLNKSKQAIIKTRQTNQRRLKLREEIYVKNRALHQEGFLSSTQLSLIEEAYLQTLEDSEFLEREITNIDIEINNLELEKLIIPQQRELKVTTTHRQLSELKSQLATQDNQLEYIKVAPSSGFVTAIQSTSGEHVTPNSPLLSIVPENTSLEAQLLLPTRSAGFIQLNDEVHLRFDAFPYQKFGFTKGEVINIDQSLILPGEKTLPIEVNEAVYRVRVRLNSQAVMAYGKAFPLKVGMLAEADIILEKRTLLQWLLDPIYAIRGQLKS
ncbi:HlyD family secretion protein [Vibrio sp. 16]|nr:HlyD family efflux transporter periplasmic adaptor subunit [Vibrio sp. 16]